MKKKEERQANRENERKKESNAKSENRLEYKRNKERRNNRSMLRYNYTHQQRTLNSRYTIQAEKKTQKPATDFFNDE